MKKNIYGLILCGGSGTRLWPLSRENLPKQFLNLYGDKTLLQHTATRLLNLIPLMNLKIITGSRWSLMAQDQLKNIFGELPENFAIEEPCARGTCPAILLAVEKLLKSGATDEDIFIITPSDGAITNNKVFTEALKIAVESAQAGNITILGIEPTKPDTGFGYVKGGKKFPGGWYEAEKFVEKPNIETAKKYFKSRQYFWNGGIFIFTPRDLKRELKKADENLYKMFMAGEIEKNFKDLKNISFDNAIMERAENVAFVPLINSGWSDVGSWDALHEILDHDENENTLTGEIINLNGHNNFRYSPEKLVVLNNINDLVVINSPGAIFITRRGDSQEVRNVVKYLKENNFNQAL